MTRLAALLLLLLLVSPVSAKSPAAEFAKRFERAAAKKTPASLVALAAWCRKKRLFAEERRSLERAQEIAPEDAKVKKKLAWLDARAARHRSRKTPWRVETEIVFVETNTSEAKLHHYAAMVGAFYERFSKVFGFRKPRAKTKTIGVKIFRTKADFIAYKADQGEEADETTVGTYDPNRKELALYEDSDPQETLDTLFHEGTHLFVHLAWGEQGENLPAWLSEGIAEYFGPSRYDADARLLKYGFVSKNRLERAQTLVKKQRASLSRLLNRSFQEFDTDDYALAWALTYMLIEEVEPPPAGKKAKRKKSYVSRKAFLRAFAEILKGAKAKPTLIRAVGPLDALEKRWHAFIRRSAK
jgi:hypothetical protein